MPIKNEQPVNEKNGINLKKIFSIVLVLFLIIIITTGVTYFVATNLLDKNNSIKPVKTEKKYITYEAGEFLTNLADNGYIKISLVYLINDKEVENELNLKNSEIRDKILSILRSKNVDSVKDSKGMEELRKQIKNEVNNVLSSTKINEVFFTSIIVN